MITFVITDKISPKIAQAHAQSFFIANRRLKKREMDCIRAHSLRKLFLPQLDKVQSDQFFASFSTFWDEVLGDLPSNHYFFRNGVSSKMQEWDQSACYLLLVLWSLKERKDIKELIFVCESVEELDVLSSWTKLHGYRVVNYTKGVFSWLRCVKQEIVNVVRFVYLFGNCLGKKRAAPRVDVNALQDKANGTLIASLFYASSIRGGTYIDAFFRQIYDDFAAQKKDYTILADMIDNPTPSTKADLDKCQSVNMYFIYSLLSVLDICHVSLRVLFRSFRLNRSCFDQCDVSVLMRWHMRRFNFAFNLYSELFYEAVKKVSQKGNFKRMLIVFEDNVFERACIQGFRAFNQGPIEGYSHAVIYPLNLKLHLTDKEKEVKPQCDRYITCGEYASELLIDVGCRPRKSVVSACSLRNIPIFNEEDFKHEDKKTVLIALDGFYSVAQQLDWHIENKEALKGYNVIVRAHPNVNWDYIYKRSVYPFPEEFTISDKDLKEDFLRSICVIYRQASVGLQAILNGIPAIHTQIDLPLEADPIFELTSLKWTVRSGEELKQALSEIEHTSLESKGEAKKKAQSFAEEYFSALTEDRLAHFLN